MRFERTSALDRLADALRRADTTWHGAEVAEWNELTDFERTEWHDIARIAATEVSKELNEDSVPRPR